MLDSKWKFIQADPTDANTLACDETNWKVITVPHCWDMGEAKVVGKRNFQGVGWYRKGLRLDNLEDRRIYLRFGAASLAARVFVNEKLVGEHRGGFGAFCFDVTTFVHRGDNLLAVRVDNSHDENIAPLGGDFTIFGGLYREVQILNLAAVHVDPLDDASSGIYLTQKNVSVERAEVDATVLVRNTTAEAQTLSVDTEIVDSKRKVAAKSAGDVSIPPHSTQACRNTLTVLHPRLWNGVRDPYLYHAIIRLRQNGKILDEVTQPLGLRSFKVDPDAGLILNGKHYPFRGVNLHQEAPGKGWAASAEDQERDYATILELGCSGVRMAHYQHAPNAYSICDKSGLVVWAELALVNQLAATAEFSNNAKQQLRELIKQNYNHPSILIWSLFNEINIGNGDPRWNLVRELNALAHELDPTRPTAAASNLGLDHESIKIPDVIAFNRYYGWYNGTPDELGGELDRIRALFPNCGVGVSEFGAGASVRQHELSPVKPQPTGKWHPEEWQSVYHEAAWRAQANRPFLWCNLIWVMFDFSSDGRNEGDMPGQNDKGLVTADRMTRKDAFYFYKANWSSEPFVYIAQRRLSVRSPGTCTLKIYSNCESVECFVNGASIGRRSGDLGTFIWDNVLLVNGEARITAMGVHNSQRCEDTVRWNVTPEATTQMTSE